MTAGQSEGSARADVGRRTKTVRLAMAIRVLLFGCIVAAAYPVRYYSITAGLDPSWAYGVNYAHAKGLLWGRDVIFTYGPLAWLTLPMDVGHNLSRGIAFQVTCWLAFAGVMAWLVFVRKMATEKVAAFIACLVAGWPSFHRWDFVGPEIFIAFLAVLLLGGATAEQRWFSCLLSCWCLGWMLLFVKFTAGIIVLSAAVLFGLAVRPFDRKKAVYSGTAALLSAAIVTVAARLFYFPSATALLRYARAGLEISSGYSSAMTLRGPRGPLVLAFALLISWLLLIGCLYQKRDRVLPLALAFLGPWFVVLKHSFVREKFHEGIIFAFAPLLWGIVVLFSELKRRDVPRLVAPVGILGAALCVTLAPETFPVWAPVGKDRLPEAIRAAIGTNPVAIFPTELAYAAANGLNFRPLPVLQSYSAYTPYLDEADAAFLNSNSTAPGLLLFDWQPIDGRNPFLDVPATTVALYRHYDLATFADGHLLLRRRTVPRFGSHPRLLQAYQWNREHPLPIPPCDHLLIARVYLQRTIEGSARNFFFRVPAVTLMNFRVPPAVLEDGIPINIVPSNIEEARELFAGKAVPTQKPDLDFAGPGARYFRDLVKVEFLEFPEIQFPATRSVAEAAGRRDCRPDR